MTDQPATEQKPGTAYKPAGLTQTAATENGKSRAPIIRIVVLLALAVGGYFIWKYVKGPEIPAGLVQLSGRIEGDDSSVASKTSGRILEIHFREGDLVKQGDIIAVLDEDQIRARENQAQAAVAQAQSRVTSAQQQIAVLQQQLVQSKLQSAQSGEDSAGRVRQAESELAAAQADLVQQESNLKLAEFDREAYTRLAKTGAVSERQGKEAVSRADAQAAAVAATRRRVEAAQGAVTLAKSSQSNAPIRNAQSAGVESQIVQQKSEVTTAQFQLTQAKAQLAEAQANRQDLTIRAPFEGVVVTRNAEPGEVVSAGTSIVTIVDLNKVYLRGYIPEGQIGKVKVGQVARVFIDSDVNKPLEAYVSRIDPQATFTPENTYFRNDRVKQVVGVKLQLKTGAGFAKPGMPADGEVLVQGDTWPPHVKQQ
ncbi:MAG: HlyD family efflux transporter periplasmic adaptor subunit [Bryobacteraceae bacterium]